MSLSKYLEKMSWIFIVRKEVLNEYSCSNKNLLVTKQRQFSLCLANSRNPIIGIAWQCCFHGDSCRTSSSVDQECHFVAAKETLLCPLTSKLDTAIKFTMKKALIIISSEGDQLLNQVRRKNSHCVIYRKMLATLYGSFSNMASHTIEIGQRLNITLQWRWMISVSKSSAWFLGINIWSKW